jgi:hypothetical protein
MQAQQISRPSGLPSTERWMCAIGQFGVRLTPLRELGSTQHCTVLYIRFNTPDRVQQVSKVYVGDKQEFFQWDFFDVVFCEQGNLKDIT